MSRVTLWCSVGSDCFVKCISHFDNSSICFNCQSQFWLLVGSKGPRDRQCHLLSCPGQLKLKHMCFINPSISQTNHDSLVCGRNWECFVRKDATIYISFGIRYHIFYNIDIVQEGKNVKFRIFILEYSFFVRGDWNTCRNISCSRSRLWVELNPLSLIHADSDS